MARSKLIEMQGINHDWQLQSTISIYFYVFLLISIIPFDFHLFHPISIYFNIIPPSFSRLQFLKI